MKKVNYGSARRSQQKGAGIMAVLLGLVIAAIVAAVVYDQFNDSQRKVRIEAATAEITSIIVQAQKSYGSSNQYGGLTTALAVQSGVVPDRLRVAGTNTAQNKYNGAITLDPATITTANDSASLGYAGVPRSDCQDIVFSVERLNRGILVGAGVAKPDDGQIDVAVLGASCDAADFVNLTFRFGRQ